MEYTVSELARLSGLSARALRHYDSIGLLRPARQAGNGYRVYGPREVDRLQQILFYRALGVPLGEIADLLDAPEYDCTAALRDHLAALERQQRTLCALIENVKRTLSSQKGEGEMKDEEKFSGLAETLIRENEAHYGAELRERYGDDLMDASNDKLRHASDDQWAEAKTLEQQILDGLRAAVPQDDPAGQQAQQICALHKKWLCFYWPEGTYSPAAHLALAEGYVSDPRFTAYYEKAAPGAAEFLLRALRIFCAE